MSIDIVDLLNLAIENNSSDLHIEVGVPPTFRINGSLYPVDIPKLTPEDTERMILGITSDYHQKTIKEIGTVDFGFDFQGKARFRVSAFKQKGYYGAVLRLIPSKILTLEEIRIPITVKELLYKSKGLILVTGPTGSGKSTTLASMIDFINNERRCHIITIEDPIEFYHQHKNSIIIQREVGVDVPSFEESIKRSLRQDPDVILIGEMRDLETIRAAITAAETGHLVFATLHTSGAVESIDRIIDVFPQNQQDQIRIQLSSTLLAVISQLLVNRCDQEGRIAAFEIMITNSAIQSLIREKKNHMIRSIIETNSKLGMTTLDNSLINLYLNKIISYDEIIGKIKDINNLTNRTKDK